MKSDDRGHFEVLEGFPMDVVAVAAHGKIARDDYEGTLIPLIETRLAKEGKVHLYYEFAGDFDGFTAGAAWDDAKLGLLHMGDFARIAVVTDADWIRRGIKLFAPFMKADVHVYKLAERDDAKAWLTAYDAPKFA